MRNQEISATIKTGKAIKALEEYDELGRSKSFGRLTIIESSDSGTRGLSDDTELVGHGSRIVANRRHLIDDSRDYMLASAVLLFA